jgi:hypothetical protein
MDHPRPSLKSLALLSVVLCSLIVSAAKAQVLSGVTNPAGGEFVCPNTILVDLGTDAAVVDLRGFSLTLSYDPAVLDPISVTAGSLVASASCGNTLYWIDPGNNDGSLEVDLALLGCSVNGPGSVLTIEFQGVGDGTTTLQCPDRIFRDSVNAEIPMNFLPVDISYSCPVPTARHSWGMLKSTY